MARAEMTAAVVIPCRNEAAHVRALLDALGAQSVLPTEVVVVDDGSTDGTARAVRDWQAVHTALAVRLMAGPGRGPGPAMNTGIRSTSTQVIVRLDGHCIPAFDYIEWSLRAAMQPGVGVAGGVWRVEPGGATRMARAIAAVVSHPLGSGGARYRHPDTGHTDQVSVETVPFGTFRRALWDQLGGFDEALAANQDFDFNYRTRTAGLEVLLDRRIQATYFARPTLAALGRQYHRYGYWKLKMLRKDPRAVRWRQLPPAFVLPWLLLTTAWWVVAPGVESAIAAAMYPAVVLAGAVHIAVRGPSALASLAALVTAHVAWSAGFWRAMLGGPPPVPR